ncbi:hypothetical protein JXB41_05550 [Candidatus Woesearchaeota archaeon]|nr:hypothetical protein [Candidatus Woesearchaeota archaeon]
MHPYQQPFLFESEATVKNISKEDDFLLVELDKTIFYPGGGGQPHDTGIIKNNDFEAEVIEVFKKDGKIIHKLKPEKGIVDVNDDVDLILNKERRIALIKMHTGEHILFKSLEKQIAELKLDKINLDENESSLFVKAENLSWDIVFKAEDLANKIIEENREIIIKKMTKEEAAEIKELRIKLERIKSGKIRIINIKDFDWSACTGTHAGNTGFTGNIFITKFNFNHGSYEIRFKTDVKKELFDFSKISRQSASILATDINKVPGLIEKLIKEKDEFKEKYRELIKNLPVEIKEEKINNITFKYNIFENYERKKLIDTINEKLTEKTVICLVNKSNGKAGIMLSCSPDLDYDIPKILRETLSEFNGKGGGRDRFAQGSAEENYSEDIIEEIKKRIK